MKVSKSLLSAIAVGIVMTTTSSCSLQDEATNVHYEDCPVACETDHGNEAEEEERCWENCPACGMG